ncbi:response regulator [Nannocystis exedens]|uniref:response regulator n=1 Tax=Nannocystis exedens TaxID=54 RepID=UPI000BB9FDF4|nr:response regulator [Nannocystis exedens]
MAKLLIVEDNELSRDMLSRRLRRRGYEVLIAIDASQAIALAKRDRPDVVLMDLSLPDMDGCAATRILKNTETTARIPVIALTAHVSWSYRESALEAGCDDYDTKPIEFPRLLAKIGRFVPEAEGGPSTD